MSGKRYTEEFKIEAVKQVTERGHPATEVTVALLPMLINSFPLAAHTTHFAASN